MVAHGTWPMRPLKVRANTYPPAAAPIDPGLGSSRLAPSPPLFVEAVVCNSISLCTPVSRLDATRPTSAATLMGHFPSCNRRQRVKGVEGQGLGPAGLGAELDADD